MCMCFSDGHIHTGSLSMPKNHCDINKKFTDEDDMVDESNRQLNAKQYFTSVVRTAGCFH